MGTERIEARIESDQKDVIVQAATLTGRSISDFVISSSYEQALKTIERHRLIRLDEEESRRFAEALFAGDSEPAAMLVEGQGRYREFLKSGTVADVLED